MKRGLFIFGILYALFFAIPFPMILYYNIRNESVINLRETDPILALVAVLVSIVLWVILLAGYYSKWVLKTFAMKRNIARLKETGIHREATILTAKEGGLSDTYELSLSFKNLVDTPIIQRSIITDGKPYERRFEAGKKVGLLIDKDIKHTPWFILASTETSINKKVIALIHLGWLTLSGLITVYFLYSYHLESDGMGWRFMSFGHPLIVCPAVLLFYRILITLIHNKLSAKPADTTLIKLKGVETMARIINASYTGLTVNEQPMINFELEYTDYRNQTHKGSLKKIIGLLNLDMTKQESVSIFYLKEDPAHIAFTTDLNELN